MLLSVVQSKKASAAKLSLTHRLLGRQDKNPIQRRGQDEDDLEAHSKRYERYSSGLIAPGWTDSPNIIEASLVWSEDQVLWFLTRQAEW